MSDVQTYLNEAKLNMEAAVEHLQKELSKIRAGKASASMVDGVMVDYYGNMTPLNQVSNIGTPDARTISIKPWEKNMLQPIEQAIQAANLGFNPQNDGEQIRINIPPLTEERRTSLVKMVKAEGEQARVSIRSARRDAIEGIKKLVKEGLSEDEGKDGEDSVQKLTDKYTHRVESILESKEADIMKV